MFTRRIVSPEFGVRLTGKKGPYALGMLFADDKSPGETVPDNDPLFHKHATFGIFRVNRDIFKQSSIGLIYTYRGLLDSSNKVGGIDGRFRLNKHWLINAQAVTSSTKFLDGTHQSGPAYHFLLDGEGRQYSFTVGFDDRSPGFLTAVGFQPRVDIRQFNSSYSYRWRPEGKTLISWGPNISFNSIWDHRNTRLEWTANPSMSWEFVHQTDVNIFYTGGRELLRPADFSVLPTNRDFSPRAVGATVSSAYFRKAIFSATFSRGQSINFEPVAGKEPFISNFTSRNVQVTFRPFKKLQIDNTYLETRLNTIDGDGIFTDRIFRSRVNWQFNRKFSLRAIPQYNSLSINPAQTSLTKSRNFNGDFLAAYSLNPWTSLYVGYNSNLDNTQLLTNPAGRPELQTVPELHNNARHFYVKFSYLFRF